MRTRESGHFERSLLVTPEVVLVNQREKNGSQERERGAPRVKRLQSTRARQLSEQHLRSLKKGFKQLFQKGGAAGRVADAQSEARGHQPTQTKSTPDQGHCQGEPEDTFRRGPVAGFPHRL